MLGTTLKMESAVKELLITYFDLSSFPVLEAHVIKFPQATLFPKARMNTSSLMTCQSEL